MADNMRIHSLLSREWKVIIRRLTLQKWYRLCR